MKRFLRTAALWALLTISAALPAGADAAEEPSLCLRQQLDCQADGTYTLTLQAWAAADTAPGPQGELIYTLDAAYTLGEDPDIQVYGVDKTHSGWGQVKLDLPGLQLTTDAATGTLTVTGFDYRTNAVSDKPRLDGSGRTTFGRKLVVRVEGIRADYAHTFGGCGVSAGTGGVYTRENPDTQPVCRATFPAAAADIPLRCTYAPADQTLTTEQEVNFGYMINPPGGGAGNMPDGKNNAWCTVCYTVSAAGSPVAEYTVPAGAPMSGGQWTLWPAEPCYTPGRYTVTVTLAAVNDPAGTQPPQGSARRLVLQTGALVKKAAD